MLGSRSAAIGSRTASFGVANEASREAIRAAKRRLERDLRSSVTATDSAEIASSVPTPAAPASTGQGAPPKPAKPAGPGGGVGVVHARWRRVARLAGEGQAAGRDRITGQDDAARVVDHDHETAVQRFDSSDRVERIVGFDHRQELERGAAQHDPADRGPVIEREPVGPQVDDEAADPDQPAGEPGEVVEVGVRAPRGQRSRSRRRRTRRRALPPPPLVVAPFGPATCWPPVTRTSAGKRGVTANRWSDAVGAGRRAIPVTVAVRPSTIVVLGIPAPGWPTTTTWSLPTAISARQRSPSLLTLNTRPETVTRRHSCAAPGIPCRTSGAGTDPLPETANRSTRRRGAP